MKIEGICIQNYGAFYGSHTFQFDRRGLVLVLGENLDEPRMKSNGSAKSTIFDALDWCLFGVIPRGDHVDSIVNEDAKGNVKVQTSLVSDDGVPLQVIRWRKVKGHEVKPNGVQFWMGAQDRTALDDDETQELINRALGMDREVFHALVLHAQTDVWNYAAATDAERIRILTKVLQLSQIDDWLEAAKRKGVEVQQKIDTSSREVEKLSAALSELRGMDYHHQIFEWDVAQKQSIREAREKLQHLIEVHQKFAGVVSDRQVLQARLVELEGKAPTPPMYPATPVMPSKPFPPPSPVRPSPPEKSSIVEHQKSLVKARETIADVSADLQDRRRQVANKLRDATDFAQRNQGICGVCRQPISPEHVAREVERLRVEASQVEASLPAVLATLQQWQEYERKVQDQIGQVDDQHARALVEYQAALGVLDQEHNRALAQYNVVVNAMDQRHAAVVEAHRLAVQKVNEDYRRRGVEYSGQRMKLQGDIKMCFQQELEAERVSQEIERGKACLEGLVQQGNPWTGKQVELDHRVVDLEQATFHSEQDAVEQREAYRYVEFWIKAFGPKGLKNFILDARVQELTDAANHWMKLIFGGTSWVRFETQTQGRSTGKLSNEMNIRCFRYMPDGSIRERNFKSLSGGEKQRTSLAVDMGFSRIIANRATKRYDLLVLDEVFKHLDSAGREAVVDMLHQLQAEKSSIFVVDHDAQFQGAFEHHVVVRKQGGRSVILEGISHDEEVQGSRPQEDRKAHKKAVPRRRPVSRTPIA